ncbi:condensation domain-containing protein [Amycolatopsis sp. cmx-4-54]|uniref:condensation domain-containing protein n=1 Tax=Amycolatopsis sp. cmx-4-54 TaxID=2790936 RepID=UPI003979C89C
MNGFRAMRDYASRTRAPEPAVREAPATAAQRGLWLADSLSPHRNGYTVTHAYHLAGPVDRDALVAAVETVVARHSVLRTRFELRGDELWQVVGDAPLDLTVTDMSRSTAHRPWAEVVADRPPERLDLARGPVIRAELVLRSAEEHVLVLQIHHAVNDAASMAVIEADLSGAYAALSAGLPYASPLPPQFVDLPVVAPPGDRERAAAFWRDELAGAPPGVEGSEVDKTYPAGWSDVDCTAEYEALLESGPRRSPFAFLLTAVHQAVAAEFGTSDTVVGTTVSIRPEGYDEVVGPFVNTLPVRVASDPEWSRDEAVTAVGKALSRVLEHHAVPFEEASPAGFGDVAVTFTSNTAMGEGPVLAGLTCRRLDVKSRYCQRDLAVYLVRAAGGYRLRACRNAAVVPSEVADGLLRRVKTFLGHEQPRDEPAEGGAEALATVRRAWSEVLGVAEGDLGKDFFESGGGSLGAIRLAARLGLSVRQVFKLRTQDAIAAAIATRGAVG